MSIEGTSFLCLTFKIVADGIAQNKIFLAHINQTAKGLIFELDRIPNIHPRPLCGYCQS